MIANIARIADCRLPAPKYLTQVHLSLGCNTLQSRILTLPSTRPRRPKHLGITLHSKTACSHVTKPRGLSPDCTPCLVPRPKRLSQDCPEFQDCPFPFPAPSPVPRGILNSEQNCPLLLTSRRTSHDKRQRNRRHLVLAPIVGILFVHKTVGDRRRYRRVDERVKVLSVVHTPPPLEKAADHA